jgi:hypothetical protein
LSKFGRKVCCNFNTNVKCIILADGNKLCVFDETTEKQEERGDFQLGMCPLLPESERNGFMDEMKKEGFTISKRWKG